MGGCGVEARLLSGIQWKDKRRWTQAEIQETPFKQKKNFYNDGVWTLALAAQRGRGLSVILTAIQMWLDMALGSLL